MIYCRHCSAFAMHNACAKCEPSLSKEQLSHIATPEMCTPTDLDNQHNQCPLNLKHCIRDKSANLWHCNSCHDLGAYMTGSFCIICKEWKCSNCLESNDICFQCSKIN